MEEYYFGKRRNGDTRTIPVPDGVKDTMRWNMNNVSTFPAIVTGLKKFPDAVYSRQLAPFTPESGNRLSIFNHIDDAVIDDTMNIYVSGYVKIRLTVGNNIVYESGHVVYKYNLLTGVFGDIFNAYKYYARSGQSRRSREMIKLCDGIMDAMKGAAAAWMRSDAMTGEFGAMQIASGDDFRLTRNDVIDAGSFRKTNHTTLAARNVTAATVVRDCVGSYINQYGGDSTADRYFPRMRDNMEVYIEWEKTTSIYNNG